MSLKNGKYLKRIESEIENISPLNIGGNDGELLVNIEENSVYLHGTMLAGAMRSYLSSIGVEEVEDMFGKSKESDDNSLSKIFIYDSCANLLGIEVRSGVCIDRFSGASKNKAKFEREYICEGHKFKLCIEIYGDNKDQAERYGKNIYIALSAINKGYIALGSYKTGGSGIFKINFVKEVNYDFTNKEDLFMYLKNSKEYVSVDIGKLPSENLKSSVFVKYELEGEIETPLLVKENSSLDYTRPDDEQFKNKKGECVIPGTSLKGIIRSQGEKILKFYGKENDIEKIFGSEGSSEKKLPSRFTAYDSKIENVKKSTYSKIKVDRFTGGVLKGAKMSEEPVMGKVRISGKLKLDKKYEKDEAVGLIALVFRDIARGELGIGSGQSTGRGRIKGQQLNIFNENNLLFKWNMKDKKAEINKIDDYISVLGEE